MNNAINMLPCPMCGCSSINVKNEQPTDNSGGYFIECPDCGISTSLRYACGDDPIPLLAEQWNRRATTRCLHQIAEPAAISEGEAFQALSELTNALRERHYGRMPSEVQAAYDKAWTIVFAGEKRAPVTQQAPAHPDDAAVDALAALMKAKLTEKRAKGYGGWNDKTQCPQQRLSDMLRAHVDKGDPVDVANFCAMLSARGEGIAAAPQAVQAAVPDGWRDQLEQALCDLQTSPYPATAVAVKRIEKLLAAAPAHPAEGVPAQCPNINEPRGCWRVACQLGGKCREPERSATQPAAQGMEADLTDAQIDEAFNQMPDGAAGFLKSWGYRQFARAVLAAQAKQGGAANG